jgi:hypothetical protein
MNQAQRREGPRIVAAAISHGGKVWTGGRHADIMQKIWQSGDKDRITQEEQGFVTDDGVFLNRFQAGAVAFNAGQTSERKQTLLSEHLW